MTGFLKLNASSTCKYLSATHISSVCFGSLRFALPAVPLSRIAGKAGEAALQGRGQRWAAKAGLCPGKSAIEPGRKLFHVHT